MRPKRSLTEKELLEELEKGLSDIEAVSSDDSDNEEGIQLRQRTGQMIDDVSEHLNEGDNEEEIEDDGEEEGEGELTYFLRYVPESLFEDLNQYTNMFTLQTGTEKFVPCNLQEMKAFFGPSILTGCLKFPSLRMYWDKSLKVDLFTETMTLNYFFKLRTHIHCVNNMEPRQGNDKLWKVRPIFQSVLKRSMNRKCPSKEKLLIKQYIENKLHPWGMKLYLLGGKSGLTYNFLIYQSSTMEIEPSYLTYGQGAVVVLQLSKELEPNEHKLYCDNNFTSYYVLQILNQKSIFFADTAGLDRCSKPPLTDVKDFFSKERGSTEQVISTDGL
ncbi:hypothetical protein JTB14_004304 [Gonioctena quinquepunctata]|nr:hypothetical protein JTB14_004304 [Gonioctena quinquepunctata]